MFKRRNYTWNDGKSLSLCDRTLIMGILNGTPDSFSDGGQFNTPETATAHVKQMIEDGADIIDLGVESTRPGCTPLTADEEIERLAQLIIPLRPRLRSVFSSALLRVRIASAHPSILFRSSVARSRTRK